MSDMTNFFKPYTYDANYSLDDFLYNQKNKLNFITCYKILNDDIQEFKIFLIFGDKGTGKTHLIKSILNNFVNKKYNTILYTDPKEIDKLKKNTNYSQINNDILKYYSIIGIDDFHLINSCPDTIDVIHYFLHSFSEKKINYFIACNNKENLYQNIEDKFHYILEDGIHIHLSNPDMDVKMRYIDSFCTQNNLPLVDEQIMHLACQFDNFKNIQTVLFRLLARSDIGTKQPFKCEDSLLHQEIQAVSQPQLTTQSIISELSEHFQIPRQDILSRSTRYETVRARQIGMTLCRQLLNLSYSRIGEAFGGRDHSTVMHSINKTLESLKKDKNLQHLFQSVEQRCEHLRF